ncbi:hypothetical protein U9M48_021605 [Paspalum notatum var. saurae]|uniref:Serine-rich protein n=1 Tax=Paspalum notatum var. saurae TaxID=547442 RepID=A0AAQ3THQ4_PASNO
MASASCSSSPAAAAAGVGRGLRSASAPGNNKKLMTCLCSPTSHPGSFRCSRHRNASSPGGSGGEAGPSRPGSSRAGANKGRSVRALLLQRISGPGGERRRRQGGDFQPRPSRLRLMNK